MIKRSAFLIKKGDYIVNIGKVDEVNYSLPGGKIIIIIRNSLCLENIYFIFESSTWLTIEQGN